jgi:predicted Zn-dependent peptidase
MATSFFLEVSMNITKKTINGIDVNYIHSKKHKHLMIACSFASKIDPHTYNEKNMIPMILLHHNRVYKTTNQTNLKLDMLYGADIFTSNFQRGNLFSNIFYLKMVNQRYIDDEKALIEKGFSFLHTIIYKPKMYGGLLTKKAVNDKIEELNDILKSIEQDKASLAYYKFIKKIPNSECPVIFPYEKYLDKINQKTVSQAYFDMIHHDKLNIYVIGDFEASELDEIIEKQFIGNHPAEIDYDINFDNHYPNKIQEFIDHDDVSISRIYMGYHINITRGEREKAVIDVLNQIIGGDSKSKLFMKVREEYQMVYMIYSSIMAEVDLMVVHFEVEDKDEEKAIGQVKDIIETMKAGHISFEEIDYAKKTLIKAYKSAYDKLSGALKLQMNEDIVYQQHFSLDDKINELNSISKEELIKAAQDLSLKYVYRNVKGDTND